ncbi:MAG TPA: CopD family protein [Burkholderiales bacterium]|nr:CopD family protein [Burkholderiales bacterium]
MKIALWLHLLGVIVWVGGMFFAYMALRPAAAKLLEPPQRLPLWAATFTRFFPWVWASIVLILASGFYIMFMHMDGFAAPRHVHVMLLLGVIMMLIFAHVYFAPFRKLKRYVALKDWPQAGTALNQIRMLVGTNLLLGLVTVTTATVGAVLF